MQFDPFRVWEWDCFVASVESRMAVALFTNSVESLSACSLRTVAVLRPNIFKVANASACTAANAHLLRPKLPKVTPALNYTRAWCHGSGLVSACCRRCVTFSALRHIRRCIHTAVGKLNASCLRFHSLGPQTFLAGQGDSGVQRVYQARTSLPLQKSSLTVWRVRDDPQTFLARQGDSRFRLFHHNHKFVSSCLCCPLQPWSMVNMNDRIPNHQTKCKLNHREWSGYGSTLFIWMKRGTSSLVSSPLPSFCCNLYRLLALHRMQHKVERSLGMRIQCSQVLKSHMPLIIGYSFIPRLSSLSTF